MSLTVQDKLDLANPNDTEAFLRKLYDKTEGLGFGAMLNALRMRPARERTGLTSAAEQVHDEAAVIYAVYITAGTPLSIIAGAAPGAGEVRMEVDEDTGVPTFTFAGATTSYFVISGGPLPQTTAEIMAEEI